MRAPGDRPRPPRHLLVRGVNWLGDAVMTTPALLRLRQALPETRITLLTHEKLAGLWQGHPALDSILTFRKGEGAWTVGRRLRRDRFDAALLLPNSPRSGLEAWLAGIPRRIGGAWPWRNLLLTEVVPPLAAAVRMHKRSKAEIETRVATGTGRESFPATAHQMHHYLHLAAALGADPHPLAPRLEVAPEEIELVRQRFQINAGKRWLGINPGAEYGPAKRWPKERFIAVASHAASWSGWGVIVFGGTGDAAVAEEIAGAVGPGGTVLNLAGRTSLRELCAAFRCCAALITNDTGPMHVAAALGTPVVALFGSTSPELTGPGLPGDARLRLLKGIAPCAPCFLRECPIDFRCMRDLSEETVIGELREVIGAKP